MYETTDDDRCTRVYDASFRTCGRAPVTINVTGGDVRTVLLAVARMGNLPLIVDDRVDGTVTAHFDR